MSEAVAGYQRQAAFTKGTMELAEERKQVEQERSDVAGLAQDMTVRPQVLDQIFNQAMTPQQRATVQQAHARAQAKAQALQAANLQEHLTREHNALREKISCDSESDVRAGKERLTEAALS